MNPRTFKEYAGPVMDLIDTPVHIQDAGIAQLHAVFVGAAVCSALAALAALILLRPAKR